MIEKKKENRIRKITFFTILVIKLGYYLFFIIIFFLVIL